MLNLKKRTAIYTGMHELYHRLKRRAKEKNIPFDLTLMDLNELSIPLTCPVLNIPIRKNRGKWGDDSISIDRIRSSGGYTKDNITVVSFRANKLKSDATLDEMKALVEYYTILEEDMQNS